jgi:hypothetical protein
MSTALLVTRSSDSLASLMAGGPFQLARPREGGPLHHSTDLLGAAAATTETTARQAAEMLFDTRKPTTAPGRKGRRKLGARSSRAGTSSGAGHKRGSAARAAVPRQRPQELS